MQFWNYTHRALSHRSVYHSLALYQFPLIMKKQFEQQLELLETQLSHLLFQLDEDPIQYCPKAIGMTMESFTVLRTAFLNQTISTEEEIMFFKHCKPQVTSKLIYFNERLKMELNKPQGSQKNIKKYYNAQLKKLEIFTMENATFFKYYVHGHQYLDHCYFLRNKEDFKLDMDSYNFQNDKVFSTSHDYKAAQILANKQLQHYIISKLQALTKVRARNNSRILKWTGSKAGMVELIYALHAIGVFNHGSSDIREIVKGFGDAFDMEVGQFHRIFYEISNRKSDRTKFLNILKEGLINRMDQSDEFIC